MLTNVISSHVGSALPVKWCVARPQYQSRLWLYFEQLIDSDTMQVSGALIHVYRIPGNAVSSITVVATRLAREKSFNGWFDGGIRASREYGNKDYKKNLKARQKHGDAGMFEHCLVSRNTVIDHHSVFKKQEGKRLITWDVEWRCPGTKEAAVAVTETSGNSVELAAQLSKQKTYDDDDDNDDTRLLEAQKGFFPARTT